MKKYQKLIAMLAIGAFSFACTDKDDDALNEPQAQTTLSATSESSSAESSATDRVNINGFAAAGFMVGTKNVEMKYAAKADIMAGISLGNISLKTNVNTSLQTSSAKPQSLVLMADGSARSTVVGEGRTPEGNYTEVNFNLFKNTEVSENDPMFQKSLLITGEIDGKVTTIWSETEKNIRAAAEASSGVEVDGDTEMVLVFDMDKLFAGVDFSTAVDANGDGRIEIGPNSAGGNAAIFAQIESNLESAVVLKEK